MIGHEHCMCVVSFQGPSHRLDIADPKLRDNAAQSTLHLSDLSTDEEDRVQGSMMQYEKKIGSLMTEVGSLKNEVKLTTVNPVNLPMYIICRYLTIRLDW